MSKTNNSSDGFDSFDSKSSSFPDDNYFNNSSLLSPPWSQKKDLQRLLAILQPAMIVGGAVRNALMGLPTTDIDIATTHKPEDTFEIAKKNGFKVFPTGMSHGTVTCVKQEAYEVTTLRIDEKTDGRHAEVRFCESWQEDAERRDFTINALYATFDGKVYDCVGGQEDLRKSLLRFIGDPYKRISEDYLRILRFFRFYCIYCKNYDEASLQACYALASNLRSISRERCTSEFIKILKSDDPLKALSIMTGEIFEFSGIPKPNFDKIDFLKKQEAELRVKGSYLALLSTFYDRDSKVDETDRAVTGDCQRADKKEQRGNRGRICEQMEDKVEDELVLSRKERNLLSELKNSKPFVSKKDYIFWINSCSPEVLYDGFLVNGMSNHFLSEITDAAANGATVEGEGTIGGSLKSWLENKFPLMGKDLLQNGLTPGPGISLCLKDFLDLFCEQDVPLTKDQLLAKGDKIIKKYKKI